MNFTRRKVLGAVGAGAVAYGIPGTLFAQQNVVREQRPRDAVRHCAGAHGAEHLPAGEIHPDLLLCGLL